MKAFHWIAAGLALALATAAVPLRADSIYLRVDGIPGDSTDPSHRNWIDVDAYSVAFAPGGAAENPPVPKFNLDALVSRASPNILLGVLTGDGYSSGELAVARQIVGVGRLDYVRWTFEDLSFTFYGQQAPSLEGPPHDVFAFQAPRMGYQYREYDSRGNLTGSVSIAWDFEAGGPPTVTQQGVVENFGFLASATSSVPEPATVSMLLGGLACAMGLWWRRGEISWPATRSSRPTATSLTPRRGSR